MSNHHRTTLYIGVTNDIERRVLEHKSGSGSGFTSKYNLYDLVYVEQFPDMLSAILREKQLKNWHREWKLNLIHADNPNMKDLAADWYTAEDLKAIRGL